MTGDGGGLATTFLRPIQGGEQVARCPADLARAAPSNVRLLECTVNGQPGLLAQLDGVTRIWAILNPGKLGP